MSLLTQIYAAPSRVKGAYRFLLQHESYRADRKVMENCISPPALRSEKGKKGDMVKAVIDECIKVNLFQEEDNEVFINPQLPLMLFDRDSGDLHLSEIMPGLIFTSSENIDFCRFLAWNLCQDIYQSPGNWKQAEDALDKQVGASKLGINDNLYRMMEDWACYLGFAISHGFRRGSEQTVLLIPDITKYLRRLLGRLMTCRGEGMLLSDLFEHLRNECPVLEGGHYREEIEKKIGLIRDGWQLSTVTSHAFVRLQEEEVIKLWSESDADQCVFDLGPDGVITYSNISMAGGVT